MLRCRDVFFFVVRMGVVGGRFVGEGVFGVRFWVLLVFGLVYCFIDVLILLEGCLGKICSKLVRSIYFFVENSRSVFCGFYVWKDVGW